MLNCVAALSLREAARRSTLPPFPRSCPSIFTFWNNCPKLLERDFEKKNYLSEYPKICPIFISSCLVCARACYTSYLTTPIHGKHCFFYLFQYVFFFISCVSDSSTRHCDVRIISPCAHIVLFLFIYVSYSSHTADFLFFNISSEFYVVPNSLQ